MPPDTSSPPTLLRLSGLRAADLPPTTSSSPETMTAFLTSLLTEALSFISSVPPSSPETPPPAPSSPSPWRPKSTVSLPGCPTPVHLLTRHVGVAGGEGQETWSCRRSLHHSGPAASWAEFVAYLKDRHAEHEAAYTPSIAGWRTGRAWEDGLLPPAVTVDGRRWGRFTLRVEESRHMVGRPVLKDRVFVVVQMTAAALVGEGGGGGEGGEGEEEEEEEEFVVVSVPVTDWESPLDGEKGGKKGTVRGAYVSVERVRKVPGTGTGEIEWVMATASDARGNLPMWVQTRAVPGQIAKDVALFLGWLAKKRQQGGV